MSDAIMCDRCGQLQVHAVKQAIVEINRATMVDDGGSRTLLGEDYDLCVACAQAITVWLRGPIKPAASTD